jgi:hypothetical protein
MYTYQAKDGTVVTDIPDEVDIKTPEGVALVKARYEQIKAMGRPAGSFSAGPGPGTAPGTAAPVAPAQAPLSVPQGVAQGLKQGTAASIRGVAGGVASTLGTVVDPATAVINTILDAVGAPKEIRGQTLGSATKNLLDLIGVPQSETMAAKIVESASRGLGGAATGIGAGQAVAGMAPALGASKLGAIGQNLASGPVQQAMGEVGANVAPEIAREIGASPLVQAGVSLAGSVGGSALGNSMNLRPGAVNPMQSVVDDATRFRTQPMTSDIFQPRTFAGKTGQALAEKIPIAGTGSTRAAQQANRIEDMRDTLRRFGAYDSAQASDDVMADLLSKKELNTARWSGMKNKVIDDLSFKNIADDTGAGGPVQIAATSGQDVSRIVPMPLATKKIDDSIAFLKGLKNPSLWDTYIKELESFKGSIDGQDLRNVEIGRATIGDVFGASENDSVKRIGKKLVTGTKTEPGIYAAVNDDMGNYIKKAGSEAQYNRWKIGNNELSKMMDELDLDILKNTLEKGVDRPEVVKNMIRSKDRSVLESLNRNLNAKGREAAKTAIMQDVANKVGDSPDKFVSEIERMAKSGDPVGVFFKGDDLKVVEGLTRVLKATKRASEAALNPPTGVQAVIPLSLIGMGGGSVALEKYFGQGLPGLLGSAAVVGGIGGGARIYESPAVRNILMRLPAIKPGAKEETALFNRLFEVIKAQESKEQK